MMYGIRHVVNTVTNAGGGFCLIEIPFLSLQVLYMRHPVTILSCE